jgi:A/G-specific adenine glycosylase
MPEIPSGALPADARAALLEWYDASGRSLAFRANRDPYAVLVSEVMAQQTQISRVVPAWAAFMARFPTFEVLADATPADVLRAWQGMGYNRRALNLQRAACVVVAEHGGRLPADLTSLGRLPGIGPYTARAVASIAFGLPVGAVDTNVRRVLGRALGIPDPEQVPRELQAAADASIDRARPADWTHAVMDLGATVCRPRSPRCDACPIATWCRSAGRPPVRVIPVAGEAARPTIPFTATTRWLRGRIVDRLRSARGDAWTALDGDLGCHDDQAVQVALRALAGEGLVELHPSGDGRARLAGA